jgi:hypothetical protein
VPRSLHLYPRRHIDQNDPADQFRRLGAERDSREPAQRHAYHRLGGRDELPDGGRDIGRVALSMLGWLP